MKYEIITVDEKQKTRIVYGSFEYTQDAKSNEKIVSFLGYLKSAKSFNDFLLYEVDTDRAIPLSFVFSTVVGKLLSASDGKN